MQLSAAGRRKSSTTPLWVLLAAMALPAAVGSQTGVAQSDVPPSGDAASRFVANPATLGRDATREGQTDSAEYWKDYWTWYDRASRRYREQQRRAARLYWWRQQQALEHWRRYGWPVPRYSPLVYGPTARIQPRVGVGVQGPVVTFDIWR